MKRKRPLQGVPSEVVLQWWHREHSRLRDEMEWVDSEPHQVSSPAISRVERVLWFLAILLMGVFGVSVLVVLLI